MRSLRRKSGTAGLPGTLTPTSASLLRWWFDREGTLSRGGPAFDEQQQQAITDTIVRHETAPLARKLVSPRYHLPVPDAAARSRVFLALLVWQLLNHNDARAASLNDTRFTQHFIVIAQGNQRIHLLNALWGRPLSGGEGARDFGSADLVRWADLLIPESRRDEVYAFVCGSEGMARAPGTPTAEDEPIVVHGQRLAAPLDITQLLRPMVFADDVSKPLRRWAVSPRRCCGAIVFSDVNHLPQRGL